MRKTLFIGVVLGLSLSVQAQTYRCKEANGQYLYSDKPCVVAHEKNDKTIVDANGMVLRLAQDKTPMPLSTLVVNELFSNIEGACRDKNGEALFNQYSQTMQTNIKEQLGGKDIFDSVSYVCTKMKVIRSELKQSSERTLFASKLSNGSTVLCFYKETAGLESCLGNIGITVEQNKLKLNSY